MSVTPYRLEFELPDLPKTPNRLLGAHWRTRSAHAKRWKSWVWGKTWPYKPDAPLRKAKLTLTRFSSGVCDYDGLVGSFKPVVDGLVRAGIILNDTPAVIGVAEYRHEKTRPREGKIKIKVEEVD